MERIRGLILEGHPDVQVAGGVPADLVEAAERRLGVQLSEQCRDYLIEFGQLAIGPWELFGLVRTVTSIDSQSIVKQSMRTMRSTGSSYVTIASDGGELSYVFPVSEKVAAERIVVIDRYTGQAEDGLPSGLTLYEWIDLLCSRLDGR